jgi:hypothetical protein
MSPTGEVAHEPTDSDQRGTLETISGPNQTRFAIKKIGFEGRTGCAGEKIRGNGEIFCKIRRESRSHCCSEVAEVGAEKTRRNGESAGEFRRES